MFYNTKNYQHRACVPHPACRASIRGGSGKEGVRPRSLFRPRTDSFPPVDGMKGATGGRWKGGMQEGIHASLSREKEFHKFKYA